MNKRIALITLLIFLDTSSCPQYQLLDYQKFSSKIKTVLNKIDTKSLAIIALGGVIILQNILYRQTLAKVNAIHFNVITQTRVNGLNAVNYLLGEIEKIKTGDLSLRSPTPLHPSRAGTPRGQGGTDALCYESSTPIDSDKIFKDMKE